MTDAYTPPKAGGSSAQGNHNLRDQATDMARELRHQASDVTETLTRAAKDQAATLGTAAKNLSGDATAKIEDAANRQKSVGASYIGSIAQAVDRAAGEFDNEIPQAASYMRQASSQIQGFADAIEGRDVRELAGEVQQFARQQPTLFFGGAVILGFAALRFFKSTAPAASGSSSMPARAHDNDPQYGNAQFGSEPRRMG